MSVAEIKEQLHKAIEENDNPDFLLSLLAAFTDNQLEESDDDLSEEQYAILKEREEKYNRGELSTITLAEWKEDMKRRYGF